MGHESKRGESVEGVGIERRAPPAGHEYLDALEPVEARKVGHGAVGGQVDDATETAPCCRIEESALQAGVHDEQCRCGHHLHYPA